MKNLIFIPLFAFMIAAAYSGDFENLKIHLKNSETNFNYNSLPSHTCDLCGCYMGIDGENRNELGIRYRLRVFNGPHMFSSDPAASSIREYYNTIELTGRYFVTPKIQISFSLPYGSNNVEAGSFTGMGDLLVMAKYLVRGNIKNLPTQKYVDRIFLGGGFKIPSGSYNKSVDGEVEPHFQTGTGSYDFLLQGTYIARVRNFGMNADVVYKINTVNANNYRFANRFNLTASLLYIVPVGLNFTIIPNTGAYYEQANPDQINNVDDDGSGGKVLFVKGGLNFNLKHFSLSFDFQKPVYENFIGYQPKNNLRFISAINYIF